MYQVTWLLCTILTKQFFIWCKVSYKNVLEKFNPATNILLPCAKQSELFTNSFRFYLKLQLGKQWRSEGLVLIMILFWYVSWSMNVTSIYSCWHWPHTRHDLTLVREVQLQWYYYWCALALQCLLLLPTLHYYTTIAP